MEGKKEGELERKKKEKESVGGKKINKRREEWRKNEEMKRKYERV